MAALRAYSVHPLSKILTWTTQVAAPTTVTDKIGDILVKSADPVADVYLPLVPHYTPRAYFERNIAKLDTRPLTLDKTTGMTWGKAGSSTYIRSRNDMLTTLIGVTGKAGSGKDTVGEMLLGEYGFVCSSFADPVKQAASIIFGVELDKFYDRVSKEAIDPYWGITAGDAHRSSARTPAAMCSGRTYGPSGGSCPSTKSTSSMTWLSPTLDLRTRAALIRSMGGTIIHLSRPASERGVKVDHVSEAGSRFLMATTALTTTGTLGDLLKNVCSIVDDLERRGSTVAEKCPDPAGPSEPVRRGGGR